jgi:hypothetical protein
MTISPASSWVICQFPEGCWTIVHEITCNRPPTFLSPFRVKYFFHTTFFNKLKGNVCSCIRQQFPYSCKGLKGALGGQLQPAGHSLLIPDLVSYPINKKVQFHVALERYFNINSFYSVNEFLMIKNDSYISKSFLSLYYITCLLYMYGLNITFEHFM